jgi:hypothetical protein
LEGTIALTAAIVAADASGCVDLLGQTVDNGLTSMMMLLSSYTSCSSINVGTIVHGRAPLIPM